MDVRAAAGRLRSAFPSVPATAVVVGSGRGTLEEALADPVRVPFADVPGLPGPGVAGHGGRFVHGRLGGTDVLLQSGRFHLYEGHPADVVVAPVRILAELGVASVIMTNASGAIHPLLEPGDVVLVDDVINLTFRSPLAGPVREGEARFPDMSRPLDPELADVIRESAAALGQRLTAGTYVAVTGPQYETAAEIRMLARLGADVVGMSTVPEVVVAATRGLRVAVLSLVTNKATGLAPHPLSHEEVLETGAAAAERVAALVRAVVERLAGDGFPGDRGSPESGAAPSGEIGPVGGGAGQSGEAK